MKIAVVFAFDTLEEAFEFGPTFDMDLVSKMKLVTSMISEIDYEGLIDVFEHEYECFVIVLLKDEYEMVYKSKPEYEAAG